MNLDMFFSFVGLKTEVFMLYLTEISFSSDENTKQIPADNRCVKIIA